MQFDVHHNVPKQVEELLQGLADQIGAVHKLVETARVYLTWDELDDMNLKTTPPSELSCFYLQSAYESMCDAVQTWVAACKEYEEVSP